VTNTNEPSWDEIFRPAGGEPARPQTPAMPEPGADAYPGVRASDPFAVAAAEAQSQTNAPADEPLTRRQLREREEQHGVRGGRDGRPPSDGRGKPTKKRRGLIAILAIAAVLLAGGGGAAAFAWINYEDKVRELLGWELSNDYTGEGNGTEALVTIASGDLGDDVARKLHQAGVTMTFDAVWEYLLEREAAGDPVVFFPGTFRLEKEMSAEAAVAAVTDPVNQLINQVLITEGMSYQGALEQIAAATEIPIEELQAAADDYTSFGVPADAPNIEGWMFPATYQFDPGITAQDAIQITVDKMFETLDALGVAPENRLDILKMAALVQREAGSNEDMPKIARVFYNRIEQNMLLESDATVAYGTGNTHTVWTTAEERENPDNLYSTYVHPGLPYGPIGLPGEEAIKAAITPADGPWLFFVPINLQTGETVFSETAAQHEAAAQQLYAWCRASDENASYCE
jgi:UPF0755 protein